MSKLRHYKGDGWEVKVKYDEECRIMLWRDSVNRTPLTTFDSPVNEILKSINKKSEGNYYIGKHTYDRLTEHLDNLTKPKIINEHTFDNPNFKIRIWETEDKIGAETVFVREGFGYRPDKQETIIDSDCLTILSNVNAHFGLCRNNYEQSKAGLKYTYTDLCKALERAVEETKAPKLIDRNEFLQDFYDFLDSYGFNQTKEG